MWLNNLKIAIIEKNTDNIDKLLTTTPEFTNTKEIETVMYLLKEASALIYALKDETADTMLKIKKNLNYIKSTQSQDSFSFFNSKV